MDMLFSQWLHGKQQQHFYLIGRRLTIMLNLLLVEYNYRLAIILFFCILLPIWFKVFI